jgi:hypothetical protein
VSGHVWHQQEDSRDVGHVGLFSGVADFAPNSAHYTPDSAPGKADLRMIGLVKSGYVGPAISRQRCSDQEAEQ